MTSSIATYRNLRDKLLALDAKLSPDERVKFREFLPNQVFGTNSESIEFLFAAPEEILNAKELDVFSRLSQARDVDQCNPCALRPSMVMIMKATRLCNLRCVYCHSWKEGPNQVMSFEVLAKATRDALRRPEVNHVDFVWHGGEVTLLPISFFRKALWLQTAFRRDGQHVTNSIQTNATRLTAEWVDFFRAGNFNVGISIDGPQEVHDQRRRTARGKPTWEQVRAGIVRLKRANISFGALVVLDREIVRLGAERLLNALFELELTGASLLNVLPANDEKAPSDGSYLPFSEYVEFLRRLFQLWWPKYRDNIDILPLNSLINNLSGRPPDLCVFAGNCMGQYLTIEPNGGISACDKYIGDVNFEFGNIMAAELNDVLVRSENLWRARECADGEITRMAQCKYYAVCHGGCAHDRRLNQWYQPGWDGHCCGLAELLDEMSATVHNGRN